MGRLNGFFDATFHKWSALNAYTIRNIYEVYPQNILQVGINFWKICRTEGDSDAISAHFQISGCGRQTLLSRF